ncbi:MAG: hypothetical protein CMQ11_15325 [Gammaproteobacteria bacterium]|nr:hypothetical protein [Gammaproteobacteria bacterium]
MIVCLCNRISSCDIQSYLDQGRGLSVVVLGLGLGTCCGTCLEIAQELAESNLKASSLRINTVPSLLLLPSDPGLAVVIGYSTCP